MIGTHALTFSLAKAIPISSTRFTSAAIFVIILVSRTMNIPVSKLYTALIKFLCLPVSLWKPYDHVHHTNQKNND